MSTHFHHSFASGRASRGTFTKTPVALAVLLALSGAGSVQAQDAVLEEISVTGSRIRESGMTTPTPVTTVSLTELQAMAPGTLVEGMAQLPQFYGSTTTASTQGFFTSPGAGSLNLRGLATKRTLTLLNGRRVVSSTIYGGPDINLFPENMLRSVESVTGGATAAYGTDAVSGVVNFILDTDFTGFRGSVQGGETTRGDNENVEVSLAGGFQTGERTHVLVSAEMYEQDPVRTFDDRDWYQSWGRVRNGAADAGSSAANPREFILPQVVSTNASYDGVVIWPATATLPRMIFNSDGTYSPFVFGDLSSLPGGSHTIRGGGSGTDNNADRPSLQNESSRENVFVYVDHELDDELTLFAQGIYGKASFTSTNAGGLFHGGSGQPLTIFQNNAFLPDSLRQVMATNNIPSFTLGRIGHGSDLAGDAATTQDTETWSFTTGFEAQIISDGFFDGWNVDGYFQYGETAALAQQKGGIRLDRVFLALDAVRDPATGAIVCNNTLVSGQNPDCVPLNLFGRGHASRAAIDWVSGFDEGLAVATTPYLPGYPPETYSYVSGPHKVRDIDLEQSVVEVSASGEIAEGWGAGAISLALGAHWREESLDQKVQAAQGNPSADPFAFPVAANNAALGIRGVPAGAANNSVEIQFSKVPFARGEFDVTELFSEVLVPLLAEQPLMQQLNLSGAVRWAEYGGSGEIWSYKAGLSAAFNDELRLRGTYSRDVRAATLGERFDRTGGTANVQDYGENLNAPPQYQILTVQGGNPNVEPEEADTFTVGLVYRPQWFSGLDLSVDWYEVELEGSIESFTAQQIIDACYRRNDTGQCGFIERNAPGNRISIVNQSFQNVSKAKVAGVDFELAYRTEIDLFGGGEQLGLRLLGSWLDENSTTGATGVKTDRAGETGAASLPEWKYTTSLNYSRGPLNLFVQGRWLDEGLLSATNNLVSATTGQRVWDVADNTVDSVFYLDTRVAWTMATGNGSVELYANINNLLDEDPPVTATFAGFGANPAQVNAALFDQLGRRYTLGMRFDF